MTYCVGMLLKAGLVMMSDTRTNAGVDNISTYRKMTIWEPLIWSPVRRPSIPHAADMNCLLASISSAGTTPSLRIFCS